MKYEIKFTHTVNYKRIQGQGLRFNLEWSKSEEWCLVLVFIVARRRDLCDSSQVRDLHGFNFPPTPREWMAGLFLLLYTDIGQKGYTKGQKWQYQKEQLALIHQNRIFSFIIASVQKIPHILCKNLFKMVHRPQSKT